MERTWVGLQIALVVVAAILTSVSAEAQELLHARISYEAGGAFVRGVNEDEWGYATVNTLILPGDTLWVDKGGMIELEMSGGSFLRMADSSKAEIAQLPPSATVRGWSGSFYVQRVSRSTGEFTFATPACQVEVERDTHVRVDVVGEGATTVTVRWGRARVRTEMGSPVLVTNGKRVYVDPGYLPSALTAFDRTVEDAFDVWNRERARLLALGMNPMPAAVRVDTPPIGASDLAVHGEWVTIDAVPYWRPTVVVDYVPYRYGYWTYVPVCGYVWVGTYPFCYVTTHYGRWFCHPTYGWVWTYRDVWGPAWVASVRCGPNFVWCPLDPWDRPCVVGAVTVDLGGIRFSLAGTSYCAAEELIIGPCPVYCVTRETLRPVGDVYIWNIYAPGWSRPRLPYLESPTLVRDYTPRRVIRGPESSGAGGGLEARLRVAELEPTIRRTAFSATPVTGGRVMRTPSTTASREAQVRAVALNEEARQTSPFSRSDRMADARDARRVRQTTAPTGPLAARPTGPESRSTLAVPATRSSGDLTSGIRSRRTFRAPESPTESLPGPTSTTAPNGGAGPVAPETPSRGGTRGPREPRITPVPPVSTPNPQVPETPSVPSSPRELRTPRTMPMPRDSRATEISPFINQNPRVTEIPTPLREPREPRMTPVPRGPQPAPRVVERPSSPEATSVPRLSLPRKPELPSQASAPVSPREPREFRVTPAPRTSEPSSGVVERPRTTIPRAVTHTEETSPRAITTPSVPIERPSATLAPPPVSRVSVERASPPAVTAPTQDTGTFSRSPRTFETPRSLEAPSPRTSTVDRAIVVSPPSRSSTRETSGGGSGVSSRTGSRSDSGASFNRVGRSGR